MMAENIKRIFRNADCVTFDVDSTVCKDEGIDELASFLMRKKEVADLTIQAMDGKISYTDSLRRRLEMIQPSQKDLDAFKKHKNINLSPGIDAVIQRLHNLNIPVYLITGGFSDLVDDVAKCLNIPLENVFANKILFDKKGKYAGFDETRPTSKNSGKSDVIRELKRKHGYKMLVHIGDGMTDASASPPADAFIGYGGNQVRESVRSVSQWYIMNFNELTDELNE